LNKSQEIISFLVHITIYKRLLIFVQADGPSYVNKIKGTYAFKIKGGPGKTNLSI
jgi:hypothetical protein